MRTDQQADHWILRVKRMTEQELGDMFVAIVVMLGWVAVILLYVTGALR